MSYSFDEIIPRRGTDSLKFDFAALRGKPEDVLPLWVADMDFKAPPQVLEALAQRIEHGVFGYSDDADASYFNALHSWYSGRFGWEICKEWLVKTPGVVYAICSAIRALTNEGDSVLIQQPVYYPFEGSIKENNRNIVVNELVYHNGKYTIDLQDFEQKITAQKVKLFILCSPHNPVGRVWKKEELTAMGDICLKHGVYVVSDEIHADFVYPGYQHFVFANLKPEFADITVTCTAPSKTFNLAGLQISNVFAANKAIRDKIKNEISRTGYDQPNLMGLIACRAAYEHGAEWLDSLKDYLRQNLDFIRKELHENFPQIKLVEPEGTYLIWLDLKSMGISDDAAEDFIVNKAKLWLDAGTMFGKGGSGFQRVNIACPRQTLREAITRLKQALK